MKRPINKKTQDQVAAATALADAPVLALTVRPPWSHWISRGIKRVENRTWAPPAGWRGQLVIHAGKTVDLDGFAIGAQHGHPVDLDEVNRGEYIAVATLADVHPAGPDCQPACTPWASTTACTGCWQASVAWSPSKDPAASGCSSHRRT